MEALHPSLISSGSGRAVQKGRDGDNNHEAQRSRRGTRIKQQIADGHNRHEAMETET